MLTKEQLNIFSVFIKDIFREFTFKEIKELSKQKSNNVTQLAIKEFINQNIIETKTVGDVKTYSLNLNNNLTFSYLNLIHNLEIKNKKIPKDILQNIQIRTQKYTPFFTLLVFGSYAKSKATQKSDLDIAIIVESDQAKKEILPYLETIRRREVLKIDYHIFTKDEFIEMLTSEQENVGKQIYRENVIYYGAISYYTIIGRLKNEHTV